MSQGKYALVRSIISLLEDELAAAGYELLDVRLFRGGGRLQVRLFVDTPGGIDLDGCAAAARTAGMLLEEADLIGDRYVMEVSSPGIRRPLRTPDHFAAHTGEKVDLKIGSPMRRGQLRGELIAATRMEIQVQPDAGSGSDPEANTALVTLSYTEILEANLNPDFDVQALIRADRRRRKDERRAHRHHRKGKKQTRRPKP